MTNTNDARNRMLEEIAHTQLGIRTLETRNADRLDFHEVAVWRLKAALAKAYDAGANQATEAGRRMADALRVIALDERIRTWLHEHDPKALEQVRDALVVAPPRNDEPRMMPAGICPRCGEDDHDRLVWDEHGETVTCQRCGTKYTVHQID